MSSRAERIEALYNAGLKYSTAVFMHLVAFHSQYVLLRNKKLRENYPLTEEFKGLWPIVLPGNEDEERSETYVFFGTSVVIYRRAGAERYQVYIDAKESSVEYLIDNYDEKTIEPFLFNLNLFSRKDGPSNFGE